MKKYYEAPSVEKIAFAYRDQVVVASTPTGGACTQYYQGQKDLSGSTPCTPIRWENNNSHLN